MIFTFFIVIVFLAELIITSFIINKLRIIDNALLEANSTIESAKPVIQDISILSRKISAQLIVMADDFVDKVKKNTEYLCLSKLNTLLISILLFKLNIKFLKKLRKSSLGKLLIKGFSILQSVV